VVLVATWLRLLSVAPWKRSRRFLVSAGASRFRLRALFVLLARPCRVRPVLRPQPLFRTRLLQRSAALLVRPLPAVRVRPRFAPLLVLLLRPLRRTRARVQRRSAALLVLRLRAVRVRARCARFLVLLLRPLRRPRLRLLPPSLALLVLRLPAVRVRARCARFLVPLLRPLRRTRLSLLPPSAALLARPVTRLLVAPAPVQAPHSRVLL